MFRKSLRALKKKPKIKLTEGKKGIAKNERFERFSSGRRRKKPRKTAKKP